MNDFKRNIFMKSASAEAPPSPFTYDISKGTQICSGGYVSIGGTITDVPVFSTIVRTSWTDGTMLYSDIGLTTPIANGFYRSITGGTTDLFYFSIVSGAITNYTPPMTGC